MQSPNNAPLRREQFNTLGQSGTTSTLQSKAKPQITVQGTGTNISRAEVMENRTKRKLIGQKITLALIKVSEKKGNINRMPYYWNTFHCQNKLVTVNGMMYGKYCRGLHCPVCNGIRKAELINKYYPFIKSWTDAYFVTITAKAVSAGSLSKRVNQMIKGFQKIKNTINKRHKRGNGVKFYGIKSLECNFNPVKRTYNPHFHFIFPNKECAEVFMNEWLQRLPVRLANPKGQHIRKVESTERDMMETIKYGSKIFTDPKGSEKNHKNITPFVYASALDNIIWALKGHRLFERFGFDLPKHSKRKIEPQQLENYKEWEFDTNVGYWLELGTDEKISEYQISSELYMLLSENINLALE